MSGASVRIVADGITPELKRIAGELRNPRQLLAVCGKEMEIQLRKHFRLRDSEGNSRGWPSRHFWAREVAANTALSEVSARRAVVSIASPAFGHKVYGGTITAKRAGALSIPLSPEAYKAGSASLFGKPLTMVNRPGKPPLLVETGLIGKSKAWKIHYVLLKSVTHAADPRAWPENGPMESAILIRARGLLARMLRTRGA
jgi:hypothetical protein